MPDTVAMRAKLEARLNELAERVRHLEDELRAPVSRSFHEQSTEREDDQVMEGEEEAALAEMAAIRAALTRIEENVYGYCTRCGKAIAPARLQAIPYAAFCIDCASAVERQ